MSLFYGYEKVNDNITTGGLPTTGGDMTGDINMGSNHIITSVDPTENARLARKKYVDDSISKAGTSSGNYLLKSGGTMTGNITMGNNKISTTSNPISDKHLAMKKYVDD